VKTGWGTGVTVGTGWEAVKVGCGSAVTVAVAVGVGVGSGSGTGCVTWHFGPVPNSMPAPSGQFWPSGRPGTGGMTSVQPSVGKSRFPPPSPTSLSRTVSKR
jgi:hypothetical protein